MLCDMRNRGSDLGLGHPYVDIVHAGVVSVICAPAVHIFAKILCPDIETIAFVRQIHQHLGTFSRLGVFKSNGVVVSRMSYIVEMHVDRVAYIDDSHICAELLCNYDSIGFGA